MTSSDAEEFRAKHLSEAEGAVLRADGLIAGYLPGVNILNDTDLYCQPGELVGIDHRLLRRDLELLPARLAGHVVVQPEEVVAQLGEFGAIDVVGPRRQPILFRSPHPANAVVPGPAAFRALETAGSGLVLVREEGAFVESHAPW